MMAAIMTSTKNMADKIFTGFCAAFAKPANFAFTSMPMAAGIIVMVTIFNIELTTSR